MQNNNVVLTFFFLDTFYVRLFLSMFLDRATFQFPANCVSIACVRLRIAFLRDKSICNCIELVLNPLRYFTAVLFDLLLYIYASRAPSVRQIYGKNCLKYFTIAGGVRFAAPHAMIVLFFPLNQGLTTLV